MKTAVTCTAIENYQIQCRTESHAWIVDEPRKIGGDNLGPNPFDLLLGSIGSCVIVTMTYHGSEAGLAVEKIWVDVAGEWRGEGDAKKYHIQITVRIRGDLDGAALEQLGAIAARCPIKKLLEPGCAIATEVRLV